MDEAKLPCQGPLDAESANGDERSLPRKLESSINRPTKLSLPVATRELPIKKVRPKVRLVPASHGEVEKLPAIVPAVKAGASDETDVTREPAPGGSAGDIEVEAPEPTNGAAAHGSPSYRPRRLFVLTNQMNLVGILSSRVLAPRESFQKYYTDLLEQCPGWVPLLTVPPNPHLVEQVVAERGAGAPVLLEVPESVLRGQHFHASVTYVRALRLSDVVAIHFREMKSLREHRAHRYSNVHPHDDLLRVSPELFPSSSDVEFFFQAPDARGTVDWLEIDRVRGAINGVLAAADSGEGLAVAAGALGASQLPDGIFLPPWLTLDSLTGRAAAAMTGKKVDLADQLIFQSAYRILGQRDQTEYWSATEVLDTVAREIQSGYTETGSQVLIARSLELVRDVLNFERDFEPFSNPRSPVVAAQSLLMVLLRPDLGQLLKWSTTETGADPITRTVAAVLAGRLRGLARESVKLRNKGLDDITAGYAVNAVAGVGYTIGRVAFTNTRTATTLLLNGVELQSAAPLTSS